MLREVKSNTVPNEHSVYDVREKLHIQVFSVKIVLKWQMI